MKRSCHYLTLLFIATLGVSELAHGQFGIGGRYSVIQEGYWQELFLTLNSNYSDQLTSVYGMYWFRLKEKRIEFLPEIGYYSSLNRNVKTGPPNDLSAFYFQLNTDIYFLDFSSDCNCPTFSKQNDLLQRGLFAEVSAGVEFRRLGIDYLESNTLSTRVFKRTVPKIYGGLGFDIGVSDLVTVTPTAGITLLPGSAWEGVEEFIEADGSTLDRRGKNRDLLYNAGVRILLRPDYLRRNRR